MQDKLLLMSTRLKMPQPRKNYIAREDLFDKLERISEYKVILVKGSAGSGKTTLITSFAKEKAVANLKWISLDESCNNVFLFWNYLIEAVGDYLGAAKQDFMSLFDANFQKSNLEQLLTILINGLDTQEDIVIVLDDFYQITEGFLIQTIGFFLKNVSDNVHLILLTRQEPLLYLGALNMEGQLLVIDDHDLRLSKNSGIRFLTETLKLDFKPETLELINAVSEGWVGGLQLVAAAAASKSDVEIKNMKLENRLVGDYLSKEIFEVLSHDKQDFLVATSILSYFNEEICLRLIDKIDFRKTMDALLRQNILITCLDEEKGVYRYHNILRDYLVGRFKRLSKDVQVQLHIKAADTLRELGDSNQCMDQLLLAEDYMQAMKYVLDLPRNTTLFSYVERIPELMITKNPDFAYQCFFYHYANLEIEKCKRLYEACQANMAKEPAFSAFKLLNVLVEEGLKLDEIKVMPISEIDKLPLIETTKAFILIRDASLLCTQGRYDEALKFIAKAMSYSVSTSNLYITFFCFSIKAQILEDLGELSQCEALYQEMNKLLAANPSITMFNTSFYIGYTGLHLKQMDLKRAEDCLSKAAAYITDQKSPSVIGYQYNLAEYKFITGETEEALELVKELMTLDTFYNLVLMSSLMHYVFRLNKSSGELVERFTAGYESVEDKHRSLVSKLVYAHLLFKTGKVQLAVELLDQVLKHSRIRKIKLTLVQASLAKITMIFDSPGKKREIINLFREALFYCCEDKILLPFYVDQDIVSKVIRQYEPDVYQDLTSAEKAHYTEIVNLCKIRTKPLLSEREMEVLTEITRGASNKEIAERLCITMATVKSHIINIYGKLQVNNRVAAIEAAKNLRIM